MQIPPRYFLTSKISQLLSSIEASKEIIDTISIPQEIETNIRRSSTLKSSLFSARIEGSTLTLQDVETHSKNERMLEVTNLIKAAQYMQSQEKKLLTLQDTLQLHKVTMKNLSAQNGKFRHEVSAIFNQAGIAVYMPPPPSQVMPLLKRLLKFANGTKEPLMPVRAALFHFTFEKIHPFLDGNGRVGRLLLQMVLQKNGYGMKGLLPLEEFLDNNRPSYYRMLENSENDITTFVEFMLEAIATTAESAKQLVLSKKDIQKEDFLLPRRNEILYIIKDHEPVSFDIVRRRFLAVNERTLRFDLKRLQEGGFIIKRGTTKGAVYSIAKANSRA